MLQRLYQSIFGIEDFKCWLWFACSFFFQNWLDSSKEIKRQIRSKYLCIQMLCSLFFLTDIFFINLVAWILIAYSFKIILNSDSDIFILKQGTNLVFPPHVQVEEREPLRIMLQKLMIIRYFMLLLYIYVIMINHYIILETNQIYYCPKIFSCCVIFDIFAS